MFVKLTNHHTSEASVVNFDHVRTYVSHYTARSGVATLITFSDGCTLLVKESADLISRTLGRYPTVLVEP